MRVTHPFRAPPQVKSGEVLLAIDNLEVRYGGIRALKGISLSVRRGEIATLVGANGAGKSTTLRSIVRLLPLAAGTIHFDGQNLDKVTPEDAVQMGISLVPEGRAIFPNLTVRECLEIGAWNHQDAPTIRETTEDVVALFPRLGERFRQLAGTLSGGEQQMLAIGRALMARPSLLLLDEPSLGIAPILARDIFAAIKTIAASGTTVVLVEQNTRLALSAAHSAYVLRTGEVALQGSASELANSEQIKALYLGA